MQCGSYTAVLAYGSKYTDTSLQRRISGQVLNFNSTGRVQVRASRPLTQMHHQTQSDPLQKHSAYNTTYIKQDKTNLSNIAQNAPLQGYSFQLTNELWTENRFPEVNITSCVWRLSAEFESTKLIAIIEWMVCKKCLVK